jgi:molybdopterin adenylyltransferase
VYFLLYQQVEHGQCLILNLPTQPKAIKERSVVLLAAVPCCIDLIGGPYIETHVGWVEAFRPKSALKTNQNC